MRVFPNVSNQVRLQKKRMFNSGEGMNHGGMNPMRPSGNSFTNLNSLDPYSSAMGPLGHQNPMANIKAPQAQQGSSSYQT